MRRILWTILVLLAVVTGVAGPQILQTANAQFIINPYVHSGDGGTTYYYPTNGLVSYWSFDAGTSVDDWGSNDGTVNGATNAVGVDGVADTAYGWVGGAGTGTDVGTDASLRILGAITMCAWVGDVSGGSSVRLILGKVTTQNTYQFGRSASGVVYFDHKTGSFNVTQGSTSVLGDGLWHHFAATYDGSYMKVYLDGVLEGTTADTGTAADAADHCFIGASGLGREWAGLIDEVLLYNRALSSNEIYTVMQARELEGTP